MWSQAGYEPDAFWRQTPRTLQSILSGWKKRREAEIEGYTYLARMIAGLDRWPKDNYLPSMEELLKPSQPKGKQSIDDMLAAFQDMKAAGAPINIRQIN